MNATTGKCLNCCTSSETERISDHAVNVVESAEEMRSKGLHFSPQAKQELNVLTSAVGEIMDLSLDAFLKDDPAWR